MQTGGMIGFTWGSTALSCLTSSIRCVSLRERERESTPTEISRDPYRYILESMNSVEGPSVLFAAKEAEKHPKI